MTDPVKLVRAVVRTLVRIKKVKGFFNKENARHYWQNGWAPTAAAAGWPEKLAVRC